MHVIFSPSFPEGSSPAAPPGTAGRASQIASFTSTICSTVAVNSACRAISPRTQITSRVLAGEVVEIPIMLEGSPDAGDIPISEAEEDPPPRLAAFRDGEVVGYLRSEHQDDVSRLLAIGVPLSISLTGEGTMRIIVNDATERTAWLGEDEP